MKNCILALSLICLNVWLPTALADSTPPNIVIMLADDLGWGAVSYHAEWAETPNVDRIAKEGIELDRFYVAPMCTPTRAGLMTGRYPIRFGLARAVIPPQRNFGLATEEQTIADALGEVGYHHRGAFGKWHLGHHHVKWHPLSRGFTRFEGHYNGAIDYFTLEREGERDWHVNFEPSDKQGYSTDLIADAASQFILDAARDDSPYFCYVPFNAPHSPFQAKPEDIARYAKGQKVSREDTLRAMIWSMDQGVGKILEAIESTGEAENTQVWFFSDNGGVGNFKANNQPLHGSKLTAFEGGVRVPACVRWPAQWKGGRKVESTMGYIDVLPTVLSTVGATSGRQLDGVDVSGVLEGSANDFPERDWYSWHGQAGAEREKGAVKTKRWKLVVEGPDVRNGRNEQQSISLYRMPNDLLESDNLAAQYPDVVDRLFLQLRAYRSLQPEDAVPIYSVGKKAFKPWSEWRIPREK